MKHKRTTIRTTRLFAVLTLVALLPLAAAPPVHADGTWTNPIPAPSAQGSYAMAPIGEGQVLLFRGETVSYYGETWVYDLSDNTWTNQAPATAPSARYGHAMASLGEDQVLLFGGGDDDYDGETWVYDLSENTWTQKTTAAAPSARSSHAMAYLGGDQVLLFGGATDAGKNGETWVYDLSDNTWTNQAPAATEGSPDREASRLSRLRSIPTAGSGPQGVGPQGEERSEWAAPSARTWHAMTYLGEDQVLLFGGLDASQIANGETWVYDLSANTWTIQALAASPSARTWHAMASLGGDQVLLFGGETTPGVYSSETWVYDLSDNTWTPMAQAPGAAPSARRRHAMASLGGGQVLLFGGQVASYNENGETWVYDLSANTWTNQAPVAAPSARDTYMASLGGGQALLFGGQDANGYGRGTWVYDLGANTWMNHAPATGPSARTYHAMASLGGDQVLLFGGIDSSLNGDTWVYDLSANTWTNQSPDGAPSPRYGHAMAPLGGDQVLLFGGMVAGGFPNGETWVYDLSDNTWTNQAPAAGPSARISHAMASLGGDQVLLFGGNTSMGAPSPNGETWVYDLSANTWTNQALVATEESPDREASRLSRLRSIPTAGSGPQGVGPQGVERSEWAAPSARRYHAMASLGGDQVLLFGGDDDGRLDGETWVYDLSANTWTKQAPATGPSGRYFHALASLGDDQVLLFGGRTASGRNGDTWLATGFYNNQPPMAGAGPDRTVNTLALVTLDGSGSTDPDGDLPLTYLWAQSGGPEVAFTLHLSVTTFTAPGDSAVLTFTLTVTDSLGLPDPTPDEVVITVQPYRVYLPLVVR